MSRRDPGAALAARIVASASTAGCAAAVEVLATREWASTTFAGHRHTLAIRVVGADAAPWLSSLPEADWVIGGHLVAEVAVTPIGNAGEAGDRRARVEVLTLRHECGHPPSFTA